MDSQFINKGFKFKFKFPNGTINTKLRALQTVKMKLLAFRPDRVRQRSIKPCNHMSNKGTEKIMA